MKRKWFLALGIAFIAALYLSRDRQEEVLNRVRFFNKRFLNPLMLRFAGLPGIPIAVIYHVGRRSQKYYQTPLIVEPMDGGFMFALTYGPKVDWYRNIQAAGQATLHWHGSEYVLENPELVSAQVGRQAFPAPLRAILQLIGPEHYSKMKIVPSSS
jgi:deazaflavin-dependent oxidoreductase (nitroreductase family)